MLQRSPLVSIATDCKSVFDLTTKTSSPVCEEFRTTLECLLICGRLGENCKLRWVCSQAMLADCLTKVMDGGLLRKALSLGKYSLFDELDILKNNGQRSESVWSGYTNKRLSCQAQYVIWLNINNDCNSLNIFKFLIFDECWFPISFHAFIQICTSHVASLQQMTLHKSRSVAGHFPSMAPDQGGWEEASWTGKTGVATDWWIRDPKQGRYQSRSFAMYICDVYRCLYFLNFKSDLFVLIDIRYIFQMNINR